MIRPVGGEEAEEEDEKERNECTGHATVSSPTLEDAESLTFSLFSRTHSSLWLILIVIVVDTLDVCIRASEYWLLQCAVFIETLSLQRTVNFPLLLWNDYHRRRNERKTKEKEMNQSDEEGRKEGFAMISSSSPLLPVVVSTNGNKVINRSFCECKCHCNCWKVLYLPFA
jgi:hypothetical protein